MVPLGKAPKTEGQVRLTTMQLERSNKKKGTTFTTTIASSKGDNGAKGASPSRTRKDNNTVMPRKSSRCLPPTKEVDREAKIEEITKQLKGLCEGIDRVN